MQLTAAFVRRFCRMSVMRLSNPQRTHIQSCFEYDRTEVKIPSRLVNDDCTILFGDPPIAVHLNRCRQAISAGDCSRYSPEHILLLNYGSASARRRTTPSSGGFLCRVSISELHVPAGSPKVLSKAHCRRKACKNVTQKTLRFDCTSLRQ